MSSISVSLITLLIVAALFILNLLILIQLRALKKSNPNTNIEQKGYWELKYNIQMIIVLTLAVTSILAFFGYSTFKEINSTVKSEVSTYIKDHTNKLAAAFLVRGSKPQENGFYSEIKFKDLETIKGEKLPNFDQPPFISIANFDGAVDLHVQNITKEKVEFKSQGKIANRPLTIDLIIFYYFEE